MFSFVELVLSNDSILRIECLAQGHNTMSLVRLKPVTSLSQLEHSTTESF